MRRNLLLLIVGFTLVAAACSGSNSDTPADSVVSLQDPSERSESGSGTSRIDIEEATLEFTRCMRERGIDVPDIRFDASGAPIIPPELVEDLDLGSDEWQAAEGECSAIFQQAAALQFTSDPELEAIVQDQLRQFSTCMRGEGFKDFPDPNVGNGLPYPLSAFADYSTQAFQDALELCQDSIAFPELDG
ncbi:MAG: hypothetical protein GXP36_00260 [Actinobacteria bacterium]|nr:hypothetical protein [Actinomycetota bacterium]